MAETVPSSNGNYPHQSLLNAIIENGIREVLQVRTGVVLQGCLEGFDIASRIPATYEDFAFVLMQRQAVLKDLREGNPVSGSVELNKYWRYRHATA